MLYEFCQRMQWPNLKQTLSDWIIDGLTRVFCMRRGCAQQQDPRLQGAGP